MPSRAPNLLLIMTDQQKATSLGLYGNPDVRTPHLERLAAGGTCFARAYTPEPLCVPARVSFWTGRWPHQHGHRTAFTFLPLSQDNYLSRLAGAGYALGMVGKNHCFRQEALAAFDTVYEAGHHGPLHDDDPRARTFREFMRGRRRGMREAGDHRNPLPPESCTNFLLAEQAERFIAEQRGGRPWALWLSIPDPHPPYQAPEPYFSRFDPERITLPPSAQTTPHGTLDPPVQDKPERLRVVRELMRFDEYREADLRRVVAAYYAMVAFVDDAVGRVLEALEATGQAEHTIVVYTSDHGDYAGEFGMVEKWGGFYECLTRVPLLLRYPSVVPAGAVCPHLVSTLDVLPTCFALAGLEGPPGVNGRPVPAPYVPAGGGAPRDAVFSEWGAGGRAVTLADAAAYTGPGIGTWSALATARAAQGRAKMIRTARWKYCWDPVDPDGEGRELYDLDADPWELHNLAAGPAHAATCAALEQRLLRWSVMTEDATPQRLMYDPLTLGESPEGHWAVPLS